MKRFVLPVQKVNAPTLGLDVHQNLMVYAWLDPRGDLVEEGRIPAAPEPVLALIRRIGDRTHVAFEAGGSTFWLYDVLVACLPSGQVHVAQPKKIRAIANSRQKNDANDAWWLAYLTSEGRLPECWIPTGTLRELRLAVRERFEVVQLMTRAKVRLRSHLRQMGRRLEHRRLDTARNRVALERLCVEEEGVQAEAVASLLELLDHLKARLGRWERRIEDLAKDLPEVRLLRREIPGVGKTLAAVLVAELGSIERFHSARALGCYTGLTPSERSSAGKPRHGAMTREGSELLRWALTQAAMACLRSRSGPGLAAGAWIRAKEKRMGCKGKARVAGARKLAECIWRLVHWGERFDAARPFGGAVAVVS
jgi:transposase